MIQRLWTVVSTSFSIFMMAKTLRGMSTQRNELFTEFWTTLTPEQQKEWVRLFGNPPVAKLETPQVVMADVKPILKTTQVGALTLNI